MHLEIKCTIAPLRPTPRTSRQVQPIRIRANSPPSSSAALPRCAAFLPRIFCSAPPSYSEHLQIDIHSASSAGNNVSISRRSSSTCTISTAAFVSSHTGSYAMATAEHREPCESRGSCTVLGAPGGEIPPGDSPFSVEIGHHDQARFLVACSIRSQHSVPKPFLGGAAAGSNG